jgi:hypothetical protein
LSPLRRTITTIARPVRVGGGDADPVSGRRRHRPHRYRRDLPELLADNQLDRVHRRVQTSDPRGVSTTHRGVVWLIVRAALVSVVS